MPFWRKQKLFHSEPPPPSGHLCIQAALTIMLYHTKPPQKWDHPSNQDTSTCCWIREYNGFYLLCHFCILWYENTGGSDFQRSFLAQIFQLSWVLSSLPDIFTQAATTVYFATELKPMEATCMHRLAPSQRKYHNLADHSSKDTWP